MSIAPVKGLKNSEKEKVREREQRNLAEGEYMKGEEEDGGKDALLSMMRVLRTCSLEGKCAVATAGGFET